MDEIMNILGTPIDSNFILKTLKYLKIENKVKNFYKYKSF